MAGLGSLQGRVVRTMAAAVAASMCALSAHATDGHQLIGIGAVQKGTGGAGVASAKDSTWVLLNPGAITDLERRFDFSFETFMPYRTLEPHGLFANSFAGKMSDDSIFFIPSMGAIFPTDKGTLGLGLFAMNGMGVDYRASRTILPRLFGHNFDRRTEYGAMKLSGAYAYEFDNGWSLGLALNLNYARFKSDMLTLNFWETQGGNRWDDAFGGGLTLGVQKDWERWRVGAAYSTPQWMDTMGKYKDDLLPLPLDLPQMLQAGAGFDITEDVELVLDYKFIDWSGVTQIGKAPITGGFGWKDQHAVKAGVTWDINDKWTVRAGLSHAESPIDEEVVFANALFPAIVETHATAGFSYAVTENTELHFAWKHAFGNTLTDSGRGDLFSVLGRGTEIHLEENSFTVQYSYKF
ncbi:MAG: hypothetical protein GX580_02455 [Candidatus Hydrogenedens sp.]|nr:outer membrane protein transport protein [Candidatus Hydrogenedentota bacterium]NLF56479.1 hypothetical protein [Candidatus Hydrogenedens sp.]